MSTMIKSAPIPVAVPAPARRARLGIVAALIALTSLVMIIGAVLWTVPSGEWYGYTDIAPARSMWWLNVTLLAAMVTLNLPLQAVAAMSLVQRRGAIWVTVGAFTAWIASALMGVTLGGWAMAYYLGTDPGLDAGAATALLDRFASDPRLFGFGLPGSLLTSIGTILVSIGLLRSRVIPLWVPIVSMISVFGTFLPSWGVMSLITNIPSAIVAIMLGWYAYRRADVASPSVGS